MKQCSFSCLEADKTFVWPQYFRYALNTAGLWDVGKGGDRGPGKLDVAPMPALTVEVACLSTDTLGRHSSDGQHSGRGGGGRPGG